MTVGYKTNFGIISSIGEHVDKWRLEYFDCRCEVKRFWDTEEIWAAAAANGADGGGGIVGITLVSNIMTCTFGIDAWSCMFESNIVGWCESKRSGFIGMIMVSVGRKIGEVK